MWNEPSQEELTKIPLLYETETIPPLDKLIYLHFFINGCDWYIAEYDGEDIFFGYVILNRDFLNAEWGYISFMDLKSIIINDCFQIDCEKNWIVKRAGDIENIKQCYKR